MTRPNSAHRNQWTPLIAFLAFYGGILLILSPRLSLLLDEILTLMVGVQPDIQSFIQQMRSNQGGTLLAFLPSTISMKVFGQNAFAGRFFSVMPSIAACPGIFLLGRRVGLRNPLLAVVVFAACPLQFRYAMEARPYSMALCITIWLTVLFFWLVDDSHAVASARASARFRNRSLLYAGLIVTGAYTMVYSLFIPGAHGLWLLATRTGRSVPRRIGFLCFGALGIAALSLLPWYFFVRDQWAATSQVQHVTPVTAAAFLMVLHELTGAGYLGSGLLLTGAGFGLLHLCRAAVRLASVPVSRNAGFYLCLILIPALSVPVADQVFYYFFAVRQMIFVLPASILLFTLGAEHLKVLGKVLLVGTLVVFVYADIKWMTRPREDFGSAAAAALVPLQDPTACVVDSDLFTFSHPQLKQRACGLEPPGPIILLVSPYDLDSTNSLRQRKLVAQGYTNVLSQSFNGPRMEVYVRE